MSNGNIVKVPHVTIPGTEMWTEERVDLLKRTVCRGATNDELELFLSICKRTQLDPFQKQIYAIKRWDSNLKKEVMQAQTSIDGQRLIAERSGEYDGQDGPFWCGKDGVWVDVWLKEEFPLAAKVVVFKKGSTRSTTAVAHWAEHAQYKKDGALMKQWEGMPALMLAKCAESLCLRKAFPNELGGIYTVEEFPPPTLEKTRPVTADAVNIEAERICATSAYVYTGQNLDGEKEAPLIPKASFEPLPFETPQPREDLGEFVIPIGTFKGKKLRDRPVSEWGIYAKGITEQMKSTDFPETLRDDASILVQVLEEYIKSQK